MKFKNETKETVLFPVIHSDNLPSSKLIIKDGEVKEVPECAIKTAKLYGLTPVEVESPVEAEESSINKVKVETKQVKKKKAKKANKEVQ